jgi:hypothetical protein
VARACDALEHRLTAAKQQQRQQQDSADKGGQSTNAAAAAPDWDALRAAINKA